MVRQVCDSLSSYNPLPDGMTEAQTGKLTEDQVDNFLGLLACQVAALAPLEPAMHEAELYSLVDRKKKIAIVL